MKLIFLDIDGVLVNRRSLKERSGLKAVADPKCVYALNHITQLTGAKLVISSAWRFCGLEEMKLILKHWGVNGEVVGMTPDLTRKVLDVYSAVPRGAEIREYLLSLRTALIDYRRMPFVILDDDGDMEEFTPLLVQTEFESGLTESDAHRAIAILTQPNPEKQLSLHGGAL